MTTRHRMLRSLTAALILTTGSMSASIAFAASEPPPVVSAKIADGSSTDERHSYYVLELEPGATVEQQVIISNGYPTPLAVDVQGVDGFTAQATGASYGTPGSTPIASGRWVTFSEPSFTLEPQASRTVTFTVAVPSDVTPGEYLAGISASSPLPEDESTASTAPPQNGADFKVSLQGQRVIAVKVVVPGPAEPTLVVHGAQPVAGPEGVALDVKIENTGNAFAKGSGEISIDGEIVRSFDIDTFVSQTQIAYRAPWSEDIPAGTHSVAVRLEYGDGQVTNWSGQVEVEGDVAAALATELERTRVTTDGDSSPLMQYVAVVAGLLAIAAVAGAVVLRRRRTEPNLHDPLPTH